MKSKNQIFEFITFSNDELEKFISKRKGEIKLGECTVHLEKAKYVIIGVQESIGPQANKGRSGAENGFKPFLSKFLNMQSNESLSGENVCVLGQVNHVVQNNLNSQLNDLVCELDDFLFDVLSKKISSHQIPIVIGGGHNNAYPIIKHGYTTRSAKINVINLDAHADYRLLEGRHSGNPFSYAYNNGFLEKYTVFGLHERYNSQQILNDMRRDHHYMTFMEEYLDNKRDFGEDFRQFVDEENSRIITGIELDLDVIEYMPSSAFSPVGISTETARNYVRKMAELNNIAYLHFPEGAPLNDSEGLIIGKTLAYLVSDFLSVHGKLKD